MRKIFIWAISILSMTGLAQAFTFPSIDGGELDLKQWRGNPVLIVNTASRCAYTSQYDGLQTLYDRYRDKGLVVVAVPSGDFRQELANEEQVKEFCAINFNLDLPMTMIQPVLGRNAHPFYKWVKAEAGFTPRWNFNKILIAPDGSIAGTYRSNVRPENPAITQKIESYLR